MPTRNNSTPPPEAQEEPFDFEQGVTSLEQLVSEMEQGELPLESSLLKFEQGVALIRRCQQALTEAEQRAEILTREGVEPFDPT